MARQDYELNGTIYSVDPESESGQAWLNGVGKGATLLGFDESKNDESSATDATTGLNTAASNQDDTGLESEDGLSVSQDQNNYLDLIKENEKFVGSIYQDTAGINTIGYGFTSNVLTGKDGRPSMNDFASGMTRDQADKILEDIVVPDFVKGLKSRINEFDSLSKSQQDALIDLAYRNGIGGLGKSDIYDAINDKDFDKATDIIKNSRYLIKAGGKFLNEGDNGYAGIVKRNKKAAKLFSAPKVKAPKKKEVSSVTEYSEKDLFPGSNKRRLPFDINNPITQVDKKPTQVVKEYLDSKKYPGLSAKTKGIIDFQLGGNDVQFTLPDGTPIGVDLSPSSGTNAKKSVDQLKKINEWYKNKKNKELTNLGIFDALGRYRVDSVLKLYEQKDLDSINRSISAAGYSIEPDLQTARDKGTTLTGYNLIKDGEKIISGNAKDIQSWFWNNLTDEDKNAIASYNLDATTKLIKEVNEKTAEYIKTNLDNKEKNIEDMINSLEVYKYIEADLTGKIDENKLSKLINEAKTAKYNFIDLGGGEESVEEIEGWQKIRYNELISSAEKIGFNEDELNALKDVLAKQDQQAQQYAVEKAEDYGSKYFQQQYAESADYVAIRANLDDQTSEYNAQDELKKIKDQQEQAKDRFNAVNKAQTNQLELTLKKMEKEGLGYTTVGKDDNMWIVALSDDKEARDKYQEKLNSIIRNTKTYFNEYEKQLRAYNVDINKLINQNSENAELAKLANKEYNTSNVLIEDFKSATGNLFYGVFASVGNKEALTQLRDIQAAGEALPTMLTYQEAIKLGQKGFFAARTFTQQAPNLITAIGASSLGLPGVVTGGIFGLSAAGGKRFELNTLIEQGKNAEEQLAKLEENKDNLPEDYYNSVKKQLNTTIAAGKMTPQQLNMAIFATGFIEGSITSLGMGTLRNAKGIVNSLKGTKDGLRTMLLRTNPQAAYQYFKSQGGQLLGELVEESSIYISDAAAQSLIFNKEFKWDQLDDIMVSTIITVGASNGPTALYSTITQQMATKDFREEIDAKITEVEELQAMLSKLGNSRKDATQRKLYQAALTSKLSELGISQSGLEVDAMVAGKNQIKQSIESSLILDEVYRQAGVKPTDDAATVEKKIKNKIESLKGDDKKDFQGRLKLARQNIDAIQKATKSKIQTSQVVDLAAEMFGNRGKKTYNSLLKSGALDGLSKREQLVAINEKVKENYTNYIVSEAKSNPLMQLLVETNLYGSAFENSGRKNRKDKEEKQLYMQLYNNTIVKRVKATSMYEGGKQSLDAIKEKYDLNNLDIIQAEDMADMEAKLDENADLSDNERAAVLEGFKSGQANGYITESGKYLVFNKKLAESKLKDGDLMQGTAFMHELGHALDNLTMKKGELNEYALNLSKYLRGDKILKEVHDAVVEDLTNLNYWDETKSFEDQSDQAKDEYVKYAQDAITVNEYYKVRARKAGKSIANVYRGFVTKLNISSKDFKLNTPGDAMNYMISYIDGFDKQRLSDQILMKKSAKERADDDTKIEGGRSSFTPEETTRMVDEMGSTDMGWTNENWQATKGGELALSEIMSLKLFDDLIASKMKGGLKADTSLHADFIAKVYAELTSYVNRFKPENNDSLFAYINAQIGNKAGNVYNREYKDKTLLRAKSFDERTAEGAPIVQVAADTDVNIERLDNVGLTEEVVEERSKLRRQIGLDKNMVDKVINAVVKTFGTRLPDVGTRQFKLALQKSFRTELKKPIQDMMGSRAAFDKFLEDNFENIFKALPADTLIQMERSVAPENRIFTSSRRITKPNEVDRLISEGRLPKDTNRTSGPLLNEKKAYPGIEKVMAFFRGKNMLDVLGYEVGASTLGTRKDKLAMEIGVELAYDAISDVLKRPDVQERRQGILEIQGKTQETNELAQIASIINRDPNVRFSKTPTDPVFKAIAEFMAVNANKSGIQILKDVGVPDPTSKKVIIRESTGRPISVSDMDAVVSLQSIGRKIRKTTLGKETARLINVFEDKNPLYKTIMYKSMTNDLARNFIGNKNVFESLVGKDPIVTVDYLTRFAFNKDKKLDPNRVKMIDGSFVFIDGKGKRYSGKEILKFERQKLALLIDFFKDVETHLKEFPEDAWFFAKMVGDAASNGNSIFRTSASIIGAFVDSNGNLDYNSEMVEEHMLPQNNVGSMLLAAAIESNEMINVENVGKVIKATFTQLSLLKTDDNMLKEVDQDVTGEKSLVSKMPKDFWEIVVPRILSGDLNLNDGMATTIRYAQAGINLNNYRVIYGETIDADGNLRDQTITEYFGVDVNLKGLNEDQISSIVGLQNDLIVKQLKGLETKSSARKKMNQLFKAKPLFSPKSIKDSKSAAIIRQRGFSMTPKGMSTFDFDETLIIEGENFVVATLPDGSSTVRISSDKWPIEGPVLAAQGYEFDFSDFVNVRGGKEGPLLQKMKNQIAKYGPNNVFVLTARQQDAATPIHEWLKSQGINIPIENITGLGKSEGEAKAEWMLNKFAEGYNDMYFVDDAMPNVRAVKQVLEALDIKSKVVQAKARFSKSASKDFNEMLERTKGVSADKVISAAAARKAGAKRFGTFFVPPSAEDFKGLLYSFLGKGKQGEADMKFFKDHLLDPFAKGIRELDSVRQRMTEEYKSIRSSFPDTVKSLNNKVAGTEFTLDNAIRVYLWNEAGFDIPGLSEAEVTLLSDFVRENPSHEAFARSLAAMSRTPDGYAKPSSYWTAETIGSDLVNIANQINRASFLTEWTENKNLVFSEDNLNKIESIYGTNFRNALEDILYRMETGVNRPKGQDADVNKFLNWINGSVGAVMFFNTRSAVLQTLSTVNFLNFEDNNIFAAAKAFANQKQFWQDFSMIFNSDMLKQRRAGLRIDVSANELTKAFAQGKSKTEAVIARLLEIGFTPTQIADSFAIAMGGASYYRNRVNKYLSEGKSQKDAENQAFLDFQEIAEETQQSSRPDLISQQQAGALGRVILAWGNTPMQMTRLTKKSLSDLVNRRGDPKVHISRILYYGFVQNIIFGTLQTGLFFLIFGHDEEEEKTDTKQLYVLNGVLDTLLRGTGVWGAAVATLKNIIMQSYEELGKGYGKKDYSRISQKVFDLSPPLGSKHRKIMNAIKGYDYNRDVIKKMDHGINNPGWNVFTSVVEGVTNAPLDGALRKTQNVDLALRGNIDPWQRAALMLGWNAWSIGVKDEELEQAKEEVREDKAEASKEKQKKKREEKKAQEEKEKQEKGIKRVRCIALTNSLKRCKNTTENSNKRCWAHQ